MSFVLLVTFPSPQVAIWPHFGILLCAHHSFAVDDINKTLKPAEILRISLGDDRLEKLEKKLGCLLILIVFCCGNHWKFWDDRLSLEFC